VGAVNVAATGTLAPGNGVGTLNSGNVTMASASTFALEINTTGGTSDVLAINGALNLASPDDVVLTISDLSPAAYAGSPLVFITYTGSWDGDLFTYNGSAIADGGTLFVGANQFDLDYDYNGHSVALLAVPEPGAGMMLFGGAGLLGLRRRRRKNAEPAR
jgi:hypothetical protein